VAETRTDIQEDALDQLRSEFLYTVTVQIAPPRDIGETPRGNRRFFAITGGSFEGRACGARCCQMEGIGCCSGPMECSNWTFAAP
jgi:hypothetical protein